MIPLCTSRRLLIHPQFDRQCWMVTDASWGYRRLSGDDEPNYLRMLDSLTKHFITDGHWCWFDDQYSPDYTVSQIWDRLIPHIPVPKPWQGSAWKSRKLGLLRLKHQRHIRNIICHQ